MTALAPDRAVPQRDVLLSPTLAAERLGRAFGVPIEECRLVRVKYRVGARLRVVHRVRTGSATVDVTASTFPSDERSERAYAEARERAEHNGRVRPVAHDRELATVFWTFPNDRKLAHLPALAAPAPELASLVPGWSRSELAAYAPEKAATVSCLDEDGRTLAFAKTYSGEEGARTARVHEGLTRALGDDDAHLRVAPALGYSPQHRTLAVATVDGPPLLAADDLGAAYRRLGRALARLHDLPPPDGARFRRLDPDRVTRAADLIAAVRPDVGDVARSLARDLRSRVEPAAEAVCLHGDVNFRNALLENGRVVLIDLDQVAAGSAAAELGSVLASLRYAGVVGLLSPRVVPELCAALLAGYAELRTAPSDTALRTSTAAALLAERSLRVVTRVREEGLRRLAALLAAAGKELA